MLTGRLPRDPQKEYMNARGRLIIFSTFSYWGRGFQSHAYLFHYVQSERCITFMKHRTLKLDHNCLAVTLSEADNFRGNLSEGFTFK